MLQVADHETGVNDMAMLLSHFYFRLDFDLV